MVAPQLSPAVTDAVAEAIERLGIAIAEQGARLEDFVDDVQGMLRGDYDSWRRAYRKLSLPTFSGDPGEWLRFYKAYKDTAAYFSADENQKRMYNSLRGAAREYAWPLVTAGYSADHILTSLEKHFDLLLTIASRLLESIDKLAPLHEHSRPNEFIMFATQVDNIVTELSCLSEKYYLHDPRLAMKVINGVNEHNRECWRAYSAITTDLPILVKVSKFLNEQVTKVCSFGRAWVQPPASRPVAEPFDADELWREARARLERLPRLEPAAPAHRVGTFAAILRGVVGMVSAKDKWVLADAPVFRKVLDRLNPFYAWRWYEYAARRRAAAEPELATLAAFMCDEAARVSADSAPASKYHYLKAKPSVPKRGRCLCCGGEHRTCRCRALLRMSAAERVRWARERAVCLQCVGEHRHRARRCRAPRCGVPHCHRPHHILFHTNTSVTS